MKKVLSKQCGITLLEVLLSLAIIAIILVTATRYFQSTHSSQQVNEAVKMLQSVVSASDNWYWTYKSYQTANGSININALADMNLVPSDFASSSNPWGGTISVTPEGDDHVKIQLTQMDTNDCNNLQQVMALRGLVGVCDSGEYIAVYPPE